MRKLFTIVLALTVLLQTAVPQKAKNEKATEPGGYKFTNIVSLPATPVKNQSATGTCWCFATTSFMESELLRMGKGEYDLSEMFIVRYNYLNRIKDNYLRQGKGNMGEGSLANNWMHVFRDHGIVPDEVYPGLNYGSPLHNHSELNAYLQAVSEIPVKEKKMSAESEKVVNAILDIYLGQVPDTFTYKGVSYTPKSFAASLGLNMNDYVEITSFTHFPFYTQGVLEIPDNWEMERYYNVPLDELIAIMDNALNNGYTIDWDGDMSERGFSHSKGVAINPDLELLKIPPMDDRKHPDRSQVAGNVPEVFKFEKPFPEVNVTQEIRQKGYETFATTDDHLMHITGIVKDQNGTQYFITKNSWGTDSNPYGGYLNMSESYVRAKTIFIMVHKDAVPKEIRTKLGF
jgi:aminopeptidase C